LGIGELGAGSPTAAASVGESTSSTGDASTPSSTPSPSASSPSPASTGTTVITGDAVDTRWGPVQVEVTFSGDTITAVKTVQAPDSNGRDIQINNQALPILQQEALASQSADIDTVSGATYTSEGYIQSLQSAIDQR
jgi:uncharacterized protein with FMN-binding domain